MRKSDQLIRDLVVGVTLILMTLKEISFVLTIQGKTTEGKVRAQKISGFYRQSPCDYTVGLTAFDTVQFFCITLALCQYRQAHSLCLQEQQKSIMKNCMHVVENASIISSTYYIGLPRQNESLLLQMLAIISY